MLLPLFPLGTVLYPGMLLPLHIFEERYRQLVRDLLERPEPRQFGVIAIRKGRETGIDGVHSLYPIGCIAALRRVERLEDGRFDLVTVGTERFRLNALDQTLPYLQGEIEPLGADTADQAAAAPLVRAVQAAFQAYLDALTERGGATVQVEDLPAEPVLLSYVIAAAMVVDLPEHQALLGESDTIRRLAAERALLSRETAVLRATTSRPAPDLRYSPYSPNLAGQTEPTRGRSSGGADDCAGSFIAWLNRKASGTSSPPALPRSPPTSPRPSSPRTGSGSPPPSPGPSARARARPGSAPGRHGAG